MKQTLKIASRLSSIAMLALLVACGGSSGSAANAPAGANPPPPSPPANNAPTISGSPPTVVKVAEIYSFSPNASDADGDPLVFIGVNLPPWASIDENSGTLSGTPQIGDVGSYDNIVISVSDGTDTTSLPSFSVDVTQVALGSVTLSWTPPTQNEDGSALLDLEAYRFYYGVSSGNYTNQVQVDSAGIATVVIENLVPDTYFLAATAVNSQGIESRFSNEVTRTIL